MHLCLPTQATADEFPLNLLTMKYQNKLRLCLIVKYGKAYPETCYLLLQIYFNIINNITSWQLILHAATGTICYNRGN